MLMRISTYKILPFVFFASIVQLSWLLMVCDFLGTSENLPFIKFLITYLYELKRFFMLYTTLNIILWIYKWFHLNSVEKELFRSFLKDYLFIWLGVVSYQLVISIIIFLISQDSSLTPVKPVNDNNISENKSYEYVVDLRYFIAGCIVLFYTIYTILVWGP